MKLARTLAAVDGRRVGGPEAAFGFGVRPAEDTPDQALSRGPVFHLVSAL